MTSTSTSIVEKNTTAVSPPIPPYKVVTEKEFYPLSRDKPTIALLLMVRNEKKRIHVTLESVVGHVDALIVYDTGSTDNTMQIIQDFSTKHKINLYMIQGKFVNFSVSRNVSLDYADTKNARYLLLLDCNDELRGGTELRKTCEFFHTRNTNAFLVCQKWWTGVHEDKYYNTRLVKSRCGWRYKGSVHEWMKDTTVSTSEPRYQVERLSDCIALYQDRTQDDDKSAKRFARDRELLLKEHEQNPQDSRVCFYLSQTCECLYMQEEALYYAKLRLDLNGFEEERFHALMRCGNASAALGQDWHTGVMPWYTKAHEIFRRAEPLCKLAEHYIIEKKWHVAYMYLDECCQLKYPEELILFVDYAAYHYTRWHLMGIVGYYVAQYEKGKQACIKALEYPKQKDVNQRSLQFYLNKEEELRKNALITALTENKKDSTVCKTVLLQQPQPVGNPEVPRPGETRETYITRLTETWKIAQGANANIKQLRARATLLWKKNKKN